MALRQLTDRLRASAEELAAWVWSGSEDGGIDAFLNANELLPPPRFSYATRTDIDQDYVALLMGCWFLEQDITNFEPQKRYVTGAQLVERWGALPGIRAAPYIMAKIVESRLSEVHPTFGGTQGTFPDEPDWPPLESRLFDLAEVNAIELEDFGVDAAKQTSSGLAQNAQVAATTPKLSTGRGLARKLTAQAMYEAWQKAYRKLKRRHPKKSDVWHATQISKQPVSQGRNVSTIRKHMHAGKK